VSAETARRRSSLATLRTLQWGRAHVSAETRYEAQIEAEAEALASMGPRSRERGNNRMLSDGATFEQLQWGRAHVSAETALEIEERYAARRRLQWGRAHVSAETKQSNWLRVDNRRCFNGAALT